MEFRKVWVFVALSYSIPLSPENYENICKMILEKWLQKYRDQSKHNTAFRSMVKQLGKYVNYVCKCFENSLSTMLEKLWNFFTLFNVWESEIVACI